jgi:hypothetical protein
MHRHKDHIFVGLGFPLIDLRCFIDGPTYQLPTPAFPFGNTTEGNFVRSSGVIEARQGGGIDDWPGEEVYGRASNAFLFPNRLERINLGTNEIPLYPRFSFRRFYSVGRTARLEVGIRLNGEGGISPLDATQCLATVRNCLKITVRTWSFDKGVVTSPLVGIGSHIAGHYLKATTARKDKKLPEIQRWWFTAGDPMLLIHCRPENLLQEALPHSEPVEVAKNQDFSISTCYFTHNKRAKIKVWILGSRLDSDIDQLRRLRIHLFRLHAERETLKEVLRQIKNKRLPLTETTTQEIQKYLDGSIELLERHTNFGFNQENLLESAKYLADLVAPWERATILSELDKARRTVIARVTRITEKSIAGPQIVMDIESFNQVIVEGDQIVNDQSLKIGDNAHIGTLNQVMAESIANSFNTIDKSQVNNDLKQKLKDLTAQVEELAKKLPADKAEEVTRDLEVFTKEATASTPRRKWYELSANGLVEAAKAVGEIAGPVIKTVGAILALLS